MRKTKLCIMLISIFLVTGCNQIQQNNLSECEKAGGELTIKKECDGSENNYCILSDKIHCYADLVIDGKCNVEFSEEWYETTGDGMIGPKSGPRILCD